MEYTKAQRQLIEVMRKRGFEFVGFKNGVMQFDAITESDDWTEEDWAEFEKECN